MACSGACPATLLLHVPLCMHLFSIPSPGKAALLPAAHALSCTLYEGLLHRQLKHAWTKPNAKFSVCVILYLTKLEVKLMRSFHECAKLVWKSYTFLSVNLDNTFITRILVSNKDTAAVFKMETRYFWCVIFP